MNYPFWDIDIGYGILMAIIAMIHVFISHFAIGGGLYLIVSERAARKKNDEARLAYLEKLSRFFVLVSVVFGALTGVGIWFVIGLLNPTATEALIHLYVWAWAVEWTFFVVEIAAALFYLHGWKTMSAKNHMIIGWIYFVSAWLSLFVINGIVTFMLTPGEWLVTGSFWDGFFNPTFNSSLVLRTGICIMLAGLYALLVASVGKAGEFKSYIVRYNSIWAIVGLAITVPSFLWYFNAIPSDLTESARELMPAVMQYFDLSYWFAGGIAIMVVVFGFILPRAQTIVVALITMSLGLGWFGAYEFFRETIRKPYVITGYIYANAIEVADAEAYEESGYLKLMKYRTGDDGADLFRRACQSCHTIGTYRPLNRAYNGTDKEFIAGTIRGIEVMSGKMPPFLGTDEEVELLAAHIYELVDRRKLAEIYSASGIELGKRVYDIRCGKCHIFDGYGDISETILDPELTDEDYHDFLDGAGDIADEMPPFTGDSTEREALIAYLKSLREGGAR